MEQLALLMAVRLKLLQLRTHERQIVWNRLRVIFVLIHVEPWAYRRFVFDMRERLRLSLELARRVRLNGSAPRKLT
jgi:hypothetical protein